MQTPMTEVEKPLSGLSAKRSSELNWLADLMDLRSVSGLSNDGLFVLTSPSTINLSLGT